MLLNTVKRLGFYLTVSSIFMLIMIIFFTAFYYVFENKDKGGDIDSVGDAFYFTIIVTRTVGFGDISPKTAMGKMGTVANALLPATVFLGASVVVLQTFLKTMEIYWKRKLMEKLKNHSIIVADTAMIYSIIKEHQANNQKFLIIHNKPVNELPHELESIVNDQSYMYADPTSDISLKNANIEKAKQILIASSDDTANMFVYVSAKGLNKDLKAIVRVNNDENENKFRSIGAEHILPTYRILGRMISEAAVSPITHNFLLHLHTRTKDPFFEEIIPKTDDVGKGVKSVYPSAIAVFRNDEYVYDQLDELTIHIQDTLIILHQKFQES